ncbi:MAG: hypothetical protein EOP38_07565 [Rubrivivax sp.]|nr:MAG: hypothetical protein EOP38_07565 [Rubrivivax sp.]
MDDQFAGRRQDLHAMVSGLKTWRIASPRSASFWIVAAMVIASSAQAQTCPAGVLAQAASERGYKYVAKGRYCEGMLKQDQAGSTLQLLHFMVIAEPLIGAKALQLAIAADPKLSPVAILGGSSSDGVPYRFDANLNAGQGVELDLQAVIAPEKIDPATLGFIASKSLGEETYLTPVIVSAKPLGKKAWPRQYSVGIKSSGPAKGVRWAVLNADGNVVAAKELAQDYYAGQPIHVALNDLPAGRYKLQLRVLSPESPAAGPVMLRWIEVP